MSMRIRRLFNEYQEVSAAFKSHPYIFIKDVFGNPPEKYLIEYKVTGLVKENESIEKRNSHIVEIVLPSEYPGVEPVCRMSSPVFHPNIDSNKICIADYWAAGESLVDVIVRIGEIISYQNYNIKSPLNGEAAKWAGQNINNFPIDTAELSIQGMVEEIALSKEDETTVVMPIEKELTIHECSNCGAISRDTSFHKCINGHVTCPDCTSECQKCGKSICVLCPLNKCVVCGKVFCDECKITCPICDSIICEEHKGECCVCQCGARGKDVNFKRCSNGHVACPDCIIECEDCGILLCVSCTLVKCSICGKILCSECQTICPVCGEVHCKNHRDCRIKTEQPEEDKSNTVNDNYSEILFNKETVVKTIFCKSCGHKIEDLTANFCEKCGNSLVK